jgi:4-nitrophenyl phosphatase
LQIRAGARFIGTNPDKTFPSERGIVPGAGSLLALLEVASGVRPSIVGKPGVAMMEQAMARMDADPASTGMLGDRLETDILAGQRADLLTLLVLSGVTDQAMLDESPIKPDLVFHDIGALQMAWREVLDG